MPLAMLGVRFVRAWLGMDGNVVHVYREPSLGHLPAEYRIHHHLKGGWRIGKTEEHDCGFEEPFWHEEGSFPLVPILDADVVVSPSDIEFGKQSASAKAVDGLGNEGRDVAILLGPFVDWSVVLYWS